MSLFRSTRWPVVASTLVLLLLHFYLRPRLWDADGGPDFLLIAVVLYALQSSPGAAALAGFAAGLMDDALVPAPFGASTLAHTVVGFLVAWGRAVFFADNLLITAAFVMAGAWLRNLLVLLASGWTHEDLWMALAVHSPIQAVLSGVAAVIVLVIFRQWLAIRVEL